MTQADPTDILRQVLQLSEHGQDDFGFYNFQGATPPETRGRVFGGQVLAQSLLAATRTVADDRILHSMHAYFIRAGDASVPIDLRVEVLRDGRSFSVRNVHANQNGKTILTLSCSFQIPVETPVDHAEPMPENVPDPESLPTVEHILGDIDHPMAQALAYRRPFDIRTVGEPIYLKPTDERSSQTMSWMKTFTPVDLDPSTQLAALAYCSDYTLFEPIFRKHGLFWAMPDAAVASLDHAMWFHRPVRVDEWLLYVQNSPSAQSARGLANGRIYTRDGELVATAIQEGLVRVSESSFHPLPDDLSQWKPRR